MQTCVIVCVCVRSRSCARACIVHRANEIRDYYCEFVEPRQSVKFEDLGVGECEIFVFANVNGVNECVWVGGVC